METMLERLQGIRDAFEQYDESSVMPGPYQLYKTVDVLFDLCRDFDTRLTEIERKIDAVEMYQREQSERYS